MVPGLSPVGCGMLDTTEVVVDEAQHIAAYYTDMRQCDKHEKWFAIFRQCRTKVSTD